MKSWHLPQPFITCHEFARVRATMIAVLQKFATIWGNQVSHIVYIPNFFIPELSIYANAIRSKNILFVVLLQQLYFHRRKGDVSNRWGQYLYPVKVQVLMSLKYFQLQRMHSVVILNFRSSLTPKLVHLQLW